MGTPAMKLQVNIYSSDEGFAVCVPAMPGCWSQGATQKEAMENIRVAIEEYMDAGGHPPTAGSDIVHAGPNGGPALSEAIEIREVDLAD
jgi:predicted RNase H-like HicB family nuclease